MNQISYKHLHEGETRGNGSQISIGQLKLEGTTDAGGEPLPVSQDSSGWI